MSLISFHRFLITAGILFCLGFAAWEGRAYMGGAGTRSLGWAALFLLFAIALIVYLSRLSAILRLEDRSDRPD